MALIVTSAESLSRSLRVRDPQGQAAWELDTVKAGDELSGWTEF